MASGRERGALFLLAVGTAALLPDALNRFVFPKLAVMLAGALLAGWCTKRGSVPRAAPTLLALAGALLAVAALLGAAPLSQLLGRAPRYEGLIAISVYAAALLAGTRLLGPERSDESLPWWLDCLAAAAILIAIEAVLEQAGIGALQSDVTRPGSLLGNASDEGAWAVLALGPLGCFAVARRSPVAAVGALAAITTLVCSGSRGALVGAAAGLAVAMLGLASRGRLAVLGAAALIAAGALVVPQTRERLLEHTPHAAESATGHRLLATETLSLVGDHPLLGVGPGGFVDAIPAFHDARWEREIGPAQPPDSPEDWLLQAAAAGGLPLLAVALALAALTLMSGRRAIAAETRAGDRAALLGVYAGLAGYAITLLFHFTSSGTTPLAAAFAGMLLARSPSQSAAPRWLRPLASIAGAGLLIVLVAAAVAEIPLRSALIDASRGEVAAAEQNFHLARQLRPWDPGVDADAAQAFSVLAGASYPGASVRGASWASRELSAWPDSVQGLSDAATFDIALGRQGAARRALARARALDPVDPALRTQARRLATPSTR